MSGAPAPRVVVKLGGSLAGDPSLAQWLRELARSRSPRFVAVPGGGPFADAVRRAQSVWRFSDAVAHVMAIGAMDQFGHLLCAIEPAATPCSTLAQIENAWTGHRLPVWLPADLMRRDRELPRNWEVTSDTIAAWLARALGAAGLVLVKSCDVREAGNDPLQLAAAGIVDPALPQFLAHCAFGVRVVHRDGWRDLSRTETMGSIPMTLSGLKEKYRLPLKGPRAGA